jgi:monoamine oxidase
MLDVVIIGAGASGLAAAEVLSRAGRSLRLLEARPRIGGRVDTRHLQGWPGPLELGAEFIQGRARTLLDRLKRAHLRVVGAAQRHLSVERGRLADSTERFGRALRQVARLHGDRPVVTALEEMRRSGALPAEQVTLARLYVEGYYAADADHASAEAIGALERASRALHGDRASRVVGGYVGVLEAMLQRLQRRDAGRFSSPPSSPACEWARGPGRGLGTQGLGGGASGPARPRGGGDASLGVLRPPGSTGAVRFLPTLPEIEHAAGRLAVGPLFKILLRFAHPFWNHDRRRRLRDFGFAHLPGAPVPTFWTTAPDASGILTGWAGGPAARTLAELPAGEQRVRALASLSRLFRMSAQQLETLLEDTVQHDWVADPFARGGYAYTPVGGLSAPRVFTSPVSDTLFFAGEHTHDGGQAGTVHGAIETGERAARDCLAALRTRRRGRRERKA